MTNTTVKAYARERMLGNYGKAISALLTVAALRLIASGIIGSVFDLSSILMVICNFLASLIVELVSGILMAGLAFFFLKIMYGQDALSVDVFHAFTEQPEKAVRIMLVLTIAAQLYQVPLLLFMAMPFGSGMSGLMLFLTLFGFAGYAFVWLTYSQAFYLLQDFPEKEAGELLRMSKELMRGNRVRLLGLVASFVPLFLLGVVTLFLPLLWVGVYLQASQASFYRELMIERRG